MQRIFIENRIQNLGLDGSPEFFDLLLKKHLIPGEVGFGKFGQRTPAALWEAVAAAHLIQKRGWSYEEVRVGRHTMERLCIEGGNPFLLLSRLWGDAGSEEVYLAACGWLVTVLKARLRVGLDVPVNIVATKSTYLGFGYLAKSPIDNYAGICPEAFGPGRGFVRTLQLLGSPVIHPTKFSADRMAGEILPE